MLDDDEALAVGVSRSDERLECVLGLCGALLARRDDEASRVERNWLRERSGDGPHHRREVHGCRDRTDAVVNAPYGGRRYTGVTPSAFLMVCLNQLS